MPLGRTIVFGLSRNHAGANLDAWPALISAGLAAGLGSPAQVTLAADYEQLLAQLLGGGIDIGWLPPLVHARAVGQGARLVALPLRGGWLTYRSALLVRKDDPVSSPGKLRKVRVAWRDPNSASGYLFPRIELTAKGAPPEKAFSSERFYGTVIEGARAVIAGQADLCTCHVSDPAARDPERARSEVARVLGAELAEKLRVLHVTAPIPPDGLVVGPRVTNPDCEVITSALLSLNTTPEGQKLLEVVLQAETLSPVADSLLRSLKSWAEAAARRAPAS